MNEQQGNNRFNDERVIIELQILWRETFEGDRLAEVQERELERELPAFDPVDSRLAEAGGADADAAVAKYLSEIHSDRQQAASG
jgi:hypothetical protein